MSTPKGKGKASVLKASALKASVLKASASKSKGPAIVNAPTTDQLTENVPTINCLATSIRYVQGKIDRGLIQGGSKQINSTNVVDNFILMLNQRGFPFLTKPKLNLYLDLFTRPVSQLRTELFNAIQSWTKIKINNIPTKELRAGTAFEGKPLDMVTQLSEERIGHLLETEWNKVLASSTKCVKEEINFILEIAIKNASNVEKDKRLRKFILENVLENVSKDKKKQIDNINKSIVTETKSSGSIQRPHGVPEKQLADVEALFTSGEFIINKKPCGLCWICSFPIYIYQIVHPISGNKQQLNTCGEMEHVLPPGWGSIMGTLSAKADRMIERLQHAPSHGTTVKAANDVLIGFGLRASHALCNKLKSDLVFLIAIMSGTFMIGGFKIDNTRLAEFVKEIVDKLKGDGSKQSPWNYELQFRYGKLSPGIVHALNGKGLYTVSLKTPEEFGKGCSENIKKMMSDLSKAAVLINTASIKEKFTNLSGPISSQLTIRTALYSVMYWHDILKGSDNKASKAYELIWKKFNKKSKSGGGDAEIERNVDISFDKYMKCMNSSIVTAELEKAGNRTSCSLDTNIKLLDNVVNDLIETDNDLTIKRNSEPVLQIAEQHIPRVRDPFHPSAENWANQNWVQQYMETASNNSPSASASASAAASASASAAASDEPNMQPAASNNAHLENAHAAVFTPAPVFAPASPPRIIRSRDRQRSPRSPRSQGRQRSHTRSASHRRSHTRSASHRRRHTRSASQGRQRSHRSLSRSPGRSPRRSGGSRKQRKTRKNKK